jgi:hypothetical protein
MVDLSWGSDPKYIREIRSGKVVTKLFEKKTILIIGEDYWLSQAQPSNDEQAGIFLMHKSVHILILYLSSRFSVFPVSSWRWVQHSSRQSSRRTKLQKTSPIMTSSLCKPLNLVQTQTVLIGNGSKIA